MHPPESKPIKRTLAIAIVLGIIALCVFAALLAQEFIAVRDAHRSDTHSPLFAALHAHTPLPVSDANLVQTWMTFDYVDHLFALPPSYLQTALSVTDARYPRLTIREYASDDAKVGSAAALSSIESAIRSYSTSTQAQ